MKLFESLDVDKQQRIINAGMEVFGTYGFKHANTEEIARKAGISKGLLFYYFKNKQSFFLYLFDFCETLIIDHLKKEQLDEIDDYFELMSFGAERKLQLLREYPFCMEFIMQAWFSSQDGTIDELRARITSIMDTSFQTWFSHLNTERFREDVDPMRIYQMMFWTMEGYLYDLRLMRKPMNYDQMMEEFQVWKEMFKKMAYKEEYL